MRILGLLAPLLALACAAQDAPAPAEKARVVPTEDLDGLLPRQRQTYLGAFSQSMAVAFAARRVEELALSGVDADRRLACTFVALAWLASPHPYFLMHPHWPIPQVESNAPMIPYALRSMAALAKVADILRIQRKPARWVHTGVEPSARDVYEGFSSMCLHAKKKKKAKMRSDRFAISPVEAKSLRAVVEALTPFYDVEMMSRNRMGFIAGGEAEIDPQLTTYFAIALLSNKLRATETWGVSSESPAPWPSHVRVPSQRDDGGPEVYADLHRVDTFHELREIAACKLLEWYKASADISRWEEALKEIREDGKGFSISPPMEVTAGAPFLMSARLFAKGSVLAASDARPIWVEFPLSTVQSALRVDFRYYQEEALLQRIESERPVVLQLNALDASEVMEGVASRAAVHIYPHNRQATPSFAFCDLE